MNIFHTFLRSIFVLIILSIQISPNSPAENRNDISKEEALKMLATQGSGAILEKMQEEESAISETIELFIPNILEIINNPNFQEQIHTSNPNHHQESEVIIIHGTFASNFSWHQVGGDFFEAIREAAKKRFGHDTTVLSFRWNGYLGCVARIESSAELAKYILNSDKKIYTIGHSHGGNVVNLCSQMLELVVNPNASDERISTTNKIAKLLLEQEECENRLFKDTRGFSPSHSSLKDVEKCLNLALSQIEEEVQLCKTQRCKKKNTEIDITIEIEQQEDQESTAEDDELNVKIEESYLLATPVDMDNFLPCSSIVKKSYSFFSHNDMIQTVLCVYGRKYDVPRNQITNVCVSYGKINEDGTEIFTQPGHAELHSPILGHYLLAIPNILDEYPDEEYLSNKNQIDIIFYQDGRKPTLEKPNEITNLFLQNWLENIKDFADLFM